MSTRLLNNTNFRFDWNKIIHSLFLFIGPLKQIFAMIRVICIYYFCAVRFSSSALETGLLQSGHLTKGVNWSVVVCVIWDLFAPISSWDIWRGCCCVVWWWSFFFDNDVVLDMNKLLPADDGRLDAFYIVVICVCAMCCGCGFVTHQQAIDRTYHHYSTRTMIFNINVLNT